MHLFSSCRPSSGFSQPLLSSILQFVIHQGIEHFGTFHASVLLCTIVECDEATLCRICPQVHPSVGRSAMLVLFSLLGMTTDPISAVSCLVVNHMHNGSLFICIEPCRSHIPSRLLTMHHNCHPAFRPCIGTSYLFLYHLFWLSEVALGGIRTHDLPIQRPSL